MNWVTGIQRAIDYVEAHITESIDYDEVAKQAHSSSFHFQRVFSILCGFTLGDYIHKRRLSLAGNELSSSGVRVIDVALKYGYECVQLGLTGVHKNIESSWQAMDSARRILLVGGLTTPNPR